MKIIAICMSFILLALSTISYAADKNGNYAIWGSGARSCAAFLTHAGTDKEQSFRDYTKGYLTAFNALVEDTFSISNRDTLEDIFEFLQDHCELKKIDSFDAALIEYTASKFESRKKRSGNSSTGR